MPADDASLYEVALRTIWDRSAYERGFVTNPFVDAGSGERGLTRTAALLDRLGRPQNEIGTIHVAGSKGKGSTCAAIDAIARAAGLRTGRYTSPHLHSFRERIAVNDDPVDEATFAALTRRAAAAARSLETERPDLGTVTTFEMLTAMALDHFAAVGCRLAVVEVGLGGTYDATNVIEPLISVITRLDMEHTSVLGDRLEQIATAKAGIIKPGRPVVVSPQPAGVLGVIERAAAAKGSPLAAAGRDWTWTGSWRRFSAAGPWGQYRDLRIGLTGQHQVENACTAIAAITMLPEGCLPVAVDETAIRDGLATVHWPGRFERIGPSEGPAVIVDGAHSPGAFAALAATLGEVYPNQEAVVVLGTSADKDVGDFARMLAPVASRVVVTRSRNPRAAAIEPVAAAVRTVGVPVETRPDVAAALRRAMEVAGPEGLVVATGSLFVAAEAREALGHGEPDSLPGGG